MMKKIYSGLVLSLLFTFANGQVISTSLFHSLAICEDSTTRSFGGNGQGQLGIGTVISSITPVQPISMINTLTVASGERHSLALKSDGTVWAWGSNFKGQLGAGPIVFFSTTPVQVSSLNNIKTITGGRFQSFAIEDNGTLWAWGDNFDGQLGIGNNIDTNLPVQVINLNNIIDIASGYAHSIALRNDGTVWTWGNNDFGQLGDGSNTPSNIPLQVSSLSGIIAISAGWGHCLALKNDGTIWTWGLNSTGQLGDGTNTNRNVPLLVNSLNGIKSIAKGCMSQHSMVIKNDGTVWTWGYNGSGGLGNGNNIDSNVPIQISNLSCIVEVAVGIYHSMAIKNDGTTLAWGYNLNGQLGTGDTIDTNIPTPTLGLCNLKLNPNICSVDTIVACNSFLWINGVTYTSTNNTALDTLTNTSGCDSLVALNLTIITIDTSVTDLSPLLVSNATSGTYQWIDCTNGNIIIPGAVNQNYTATANGSYSVIVTQNGCIDTSSCIAVSTIGIDKNDLLNNLFIFPNPSLGSVSIELGSLKEVSIKVFNVTGQLIYVKENINTSLHLFELNETSGLYFIEINSGSETRHFKLIKN